ncbi:MAG: alkaline phosphatase family protein [Deltaproteobacteria bacterium]|nr:alkaline phosphatase family protein [Deltaproteobacteria bacterium]
MPFTVKIDRAAHKASITVQGVTQTIGEGEFSDFFTFTFKLNPLIKLEGLAKFALLETDPDFRLYLAPVNFSPANPPPTVRLSTPQDFVKQLTKEVGLFKTLGWQEETWALNEMQIGEDLFLDDLFVTMADIEKIIVNELEKRDWRLFIGVFEATDRLQHMFWRYLDPAHPLYDPKEAALRERAFAKLYGEVDRVIGLVMDKYVDGETHFIVMSDHGFRSFRKAVNINTWFVENGFMALKGMDNVRDRNLDDLFGQGEFWPNVDWARTKAYHLGLGNIYLNLFGREPQGAVHRVDYEKVQQEIRAKLRELRDPEDGRPVVVDVYPRQDIYRGPAFDFAPDLIIGFAEGYRISWQSALGGIPKGVVVPNDRKWSGDHCSIDPSLTSGVILSNRKPTKEPHIYDIAPTALKVFGLPPSEEMDGKPLY